MFRLVVQNTSE